MVTRSQKNKKKALNSLYMHAIVHNVLIPINDLSDLVRDNKEILKLEHIDTSVYPRYGKMQKFSCTHTCKEGEPLSDRLVPYNYLDDLGKHYIFSTNVSMKHKFTI